MCGMLVGADMTRRLFLVIDSMALMTNAIGTDQMKDGAKRRWWQVQMIEELNRLAVDLKHRRGRHDNYNTQPFRQKGSKMYSAKKKRGGGGGGKKKKSDVSSKVHKVQVGTAVIDVVEPENVV